MTAKCLQCGASPCCRAHLIPQAFAREVRSGSNSFVIADSAFNSFKPSQNGEYDDGILCAACDSILGAHEKYAFETFGRIREHTHDRTHRTVCAAPVSGDRLIRFAAGIAWKFAMTRPHYGKIEVGPHERTLAAAIFEGATLPPSIDMAMIRLKALRYEETFFRKPIPDRYGGVNFIRMTLGGFLMFLKIDKRPGPDLGLPEVWMKGRDEIVFAVLPMSQFEEGRLIRDAWGKNPRIGEFLFRQIQKASDRQ